MITAPLIRPFLWFDGNAREAMQYYCEVFPESRIDRIDEYPDESIDPHFEGMAGKVINGEFTLAGTAFGCLDGGPYFTFNESISFVVACRDQAEIDYYWERLSSVPEAEQCGWCKDRFGVSWQIVPVDFDRFMRTPEQIQAFMKMKKIVIAELEAA
ncbi:MULTISPECIES: VOC family protein [unclassified Microbacterium]|uniref:VOC family protein n=1 Tax=unclassified Microbacterium TaxID=2609290 RepID=UPI00070159D6|nr:MULTISPECIES: VOC family protein [unclassified Microbacterium]KQZ07958.1 3-demethylubiquinone-9 3-methyltransferase [Microbacterium sp. Root53]